MSDKVIRSICLFSDNPTEESLSRLAKISKRFNDSGFEVQTQRLCSPDIAKVLYLDKSNDDGLLFSVGKLDYDEALKDPGRLLEANNVSFNVDLSDEDIKIRHTTLLTEIISKTPGATFNFTYTFNNQDSSPYFPSAVYKKSGVSIGLQSTNLAEGCDTVEEWLDKTKEIWAEIIGIVSTEQDFLGIDTSIAPIFSGNGSLIHFVKRLGIDFNHSATTDTYLKMTDYIKNKCPMPVGLCGLMLPCLEDFELADEYEQGNFSIERNVFLSLHCGLGIDTYPIGVDEKPERIVEVLRLVQGLSNKYKKPLSVRFVSDGKAKIGKKTDFQNQYLKDVVVRAL